MALYTNAHRKEGAPLVKSTDFFPPPRWSEPSREEEMLNEHRLYHWLMQHAKGHEA